MKKLIELLLLLNPDTPIKVTYRGKDLSYKKSYEMIMSGENVFLQKEIDNIWLSDVYKAIMIEIS